MLARTKCPQPAEGDMARLARARLLTQLGSAERIAAAPNWIKPPASLLANAEIAAEFVQR
jgi:hypothetical protein